MSEPFALDARDRLGAALTRARDAARRGDAAAVDAALTAVLRRADEQLADRALWSALAAEHVGTLRARGALAAASAACDRYMRAPPPGRVPLSQGPADGAGPAPLAARGARRGRGRRAGRALRHGRGRRAAGPRRRGPHDARGGASPPPTPGTTRAPRACWTGRRRVSAPRATRPRRRSWTATGGCWRPGGARPTRWPRFWPRPGRRACRGGWRTRWPSSGGSATRRPSRSSRRSLASDGLDEALRLTVLNELVWPCWRYCGGAGRWPPWRRRCGRGCRRQWQGWRRQAGRPQRPRARRTRLLATAPHRRKQRPRQG